MFRSLVIAVVATASIAAILTVLLVYRLAHPTEQYDTLVACLWLSSPFIAAIVLALLLRRLQAAMTVLLVTTAIAGVCGVYLFYDATTLYKNSENDSKNAVLPGDDPGSSGASMRKISADVGVMFSGAFTILLAIVVPIVQFVIIVIPAGVVGIVLELQRRKTQPEINA